MSRSGYSDDTEDQWALIRWRGAVTSAIRGKRGQAFLKELAVSLDAMPEKILIAEDLQDEDGFVCALGSLGKARGMDMSKIDPEDWDQVSRSFGITDALAREIMWENDEGGWRDTPEKRWQRVRNWVQKQIVVVQPKEIQ